MHLVPRSDIIILLSWIMAGLAAWFAAAAVAAVLIGRMIARRDRQRPQEAERPSAAPRPDRADEVPVAEADLATKDP